MRKHQRGFTLVELLLVAGLASIVAAASFSAKQADLEQAQAAQVGAILAQYGNALRAYASQESSPSLGSKEGTAWLKNSSCGGAFAIGKEYLPCDFPSATVSDPIRFGKLSLSTTVESAGTAPNTRVTVSAVSSSFYASSKGALTQRSDLAGISALAAASSLNANPGGSATGEGASLASATSQVSYKANPLTATIDIIASSSPNNDIWIRTDGSNASHASLEFDASAPGNREIQGLSRIQNIAAGVLTLGQPSGISSVTGAGVVVDANAEIVGSARVRGTLSVDNGVAVTGNIIASNQVTANNNLSALANISAGQSITAGDSVQANGNVQAGGAMLAQIYYDSNNTGYYFDPNGTSNLNALQSQTIYNTQSLSSAGRLKTNEFFQLGATAVEGTACYQNGLSAKSPTGAALSCTSGIWSSGGITGQYTNMGTHVGSALLATGAKAALIQVYGGKGTACDVWDGINRYQLTATVQGLIVGNVTNASNLYAKIGFLSFMVPANTTFHISSSPYNCDAGVFYVKAFSL